MNRPGIGIVTGLRFEADALEAAARRYGYAGRIEILASGPGRLRAERAAQALIDKGCDRIMSMGLAGGLDPALACGNIVLAERICAPGSQDMNSDPGLVAAAVTVLAGISGVRRGTIIDAMAPVGTPSAKRALYREHRAIAVDMESYGVAKMAAASGIPFLALRVIADPANQEIPALALKGMREDGSVNPLSVIGGLIRQPSRLPELLRLGRQSKAAVKALGRLGEIFFAGGI